MTSIFKARLMAIAVAAGFIFSGIFYPHLKDCFIPSPAVKGGNTKEVGAVVIVEGDSAEYSFKLLEWLSELF